MESALRSQPRFSGSWCGPCSSGQPHTEFEESFIDNTVSDPLSEEPPHVPEWQLSAPQPLLTLLVNRGLLANQTLFSDDMDWASTCITEMALGNAGCLSSHTVESLRSYPTPHG